jgi:hypothetical protein
MKKGELPELSTNRNLMLFGGLQSPPETYDIKTDTDVTEKIIEEFYRIIDIVDFQFNKPEIAAKRIYEREVIDKGLSIGNFKMYVTNVLAQAYSYPQYGEYSTEPQEQDKLEEDYDKAIDGLNIYLESLK